MKKSAATRPAFTLIEIVTSLTIMSVLMLGLSGAIMIGAHAIPSTSDVGQSDQQVIEALNQMRTDFREASGIQFADGAGYIVYRITPRSNGIKGEPARIDYSYTQSTGVVLRKIDDRDAETIMKGLKLFKLTLLVQDSEYCQLKLELHMPGTKQEFFDMHAALPDKPKVN